MRIRTLAVAGVILTVGGCSTSPDFPAPEEFALPSPGFSRPAAAGPLPPRSMPPATHRWRTDGLTCPEVSAAEARAVGIADRGQLTGTTGNTRIGNIVDCVWSPAEGPARTVTLKLSTSTVQEAADQGWQVMTALVTEPLGGVGEQAFIRTLAEETTVLVRSGNATLTIRITGGRQDAEGMSRLRQAAPFIASDMLSSLVPA